MIIKQGLPKNWVLTDIETIRLDLHEGITPNKFPDQKFELYSVPQFEVGKPEIAYGKEIGSSKQVVANNTVLLCKINPRINRVWITGDHYSLKTICSTEWIPFFQLTALNSKYLSYFLQNPIFREFLSINVSGVGGSLTRTKPSAFKDYPFPLSPLPEQHQIVAKIEELFSELDNGIENLKKAREQLKTYRQAVLKYAFEGKLTAEWRACQREAGNPPEPAEKLLEQIKTEREKYYQKQLEDWKRACKLAKTDGNKKLAKPRKPKELPPLSEKELAELPTLAVGWGWVKLGHLTWSVKDGPHYSPKYEEIGIPFISAGNIRPEGVDFNNAKYISKQLNDELSKRCKPELGDILYTKGGTTGIARVNTYDKEFNVWVHVAVLKITDSIFPFFIQHALNSIHCYRQSQVFTHGVGNQDLGLTRMIKITLPICSQKEQHAIVQEIESRLSVCDKIEQTIEDSLKKAEALRQSILKKAFAGELTRDWREKHPELITSENSAEKLLEKIKAEKALSTASRKKTRSKKTKKK